MVVVVDEDTDYGVTSQSVTDRDLLSVGVSEFLGHVHKVQRQTGDAAGVVLTALR